MQLETPEDYDVFLIETERCAYAQPGMEATNRLMYGMIDPALQICGALEFASMIPLPRQWVATSACTQLQCAVPYEQRLRQILRLNCGALCDYVEPLLRALRVF